MNNRRQLIGPNTDSRPRLEGVHYKSLTVVHAYSALPHPSLMHTLTNIINQTPPLMG